MLNIASNWGSNIPCSKVHGEKNKNANLVVHNLAAPTLHSSGVFGRYYTLGFNSRLEGLFKLLEFLVKSNGYALFIPHQSYYCSTSVENSWTDKNSSNFGVASMDSVQKQAHLNSSGSNSFNYSSASSHPVESHRDLHKGIALLRKSVACLTAYCYNSLCLEVSPGSSKFRAFSKLLVILSSSKEVRSVFSLKIASSRSCKQTQVT
ncbi:hypothetical protein Bca101_018596 [Brassica carinata]